MTDTQSLKDAYTKLTKAVSSGDLETVSASLTDDYSWHGHGGQDLDKAGMLEMVGGYVTAFPDMVFDIHNMMAEGDKVSVMWTVSGTNTGPMGDVPATGKSIKMRGHVLCRFDGDKVAEEWELFDEALMMQQLGLAE